MTASDDSHESPHEIDWLPAVAIELFKSGCSENGKAVLLKSGLGKWAQTGVYAGASTGTVVATLTGVGIVIAGFLLLPVLLLVYQLLPLEVQSLALAWQLVEAVQLALEQLLQTRNPTMRKESRRS